MKYTKLVAIAAAVLVALFIAVIPANEAHAAPLSANAGMSTDAPAYSLPFVEDAQQVDSKNYEVLVTCAGSADPVLTVTDMKSGKTVKYTKLDARTWTVKLKKGRTYKISLKVKGQKAKAIKYGVC